jgi:hypothetical protein
MSITKNMKVRMVRNVSIATGFSWNLLSATSTNTTNRYQRVSMKDIKLNKVSSKWEPVKHGVPQGSILEPLLFLIYINDFCKEIG